MGVVDRDLEDPQPTSEADELLGLNLPSIDDEDSFFPPTDPVVIGALMACGFSHTSMDTLELPISEIDGQPGDEALADAVRQELRTDSATSTLDIDVRVEDRVAYLYGRVEGIEDVDNVEEVASRLSDLAEVVERLDLASD